MGKLKSLLRRGVKIKKEIDSLETNPKLTSKAFVRDSMEIARTDHKQLDRLEAILQERPEVYIETCGFLRRAQNFIRENGCTRAPSEIRRIRWLAREESDAELSALKTNYFEIFSLAVRQTAQKFPEAFGLIQSWDEHVRHTDGLQDQFRRLCVEIEEGYTPGDLEFDQPDRNGRSKVSFKLTGGEVVLGTDVGRRLTEWAAQHQGSL